MWHGLCCVKWRGTILCVCLCAVRQGREGKEGKAREGREGG